MLYDINLLSWIYIFYICISTQFSNFSIDNMAGCPSMPTTIITPGDERQLAELYELDVTHQELVAMVSDTQSALQWLAKYRLLSNTMNCLAYDGIC